MKTKKLTTLGLSVALALILSYLESLLPPLMAVPGVKVGLPNIVILFLLYRYGWKEAGAVSLIRLLLSAALFTGFVAFFYGLAGAVLSLAGSALLKRSDRFSPLGVSVAGGVLHNLGQIALAALILESGYLFAYLPVLLLSGTLAGALVGLLGHPQGVRGRTDAPAGAACPGTRAAGGGPGQERERAQCGQQEGQDPVHRPPGRPLSLPRRGPIGVVRDRHEKGPGVHHQPGPVYEAYLTSARRMRMPARRPTTAPATVPERSSTGK